MNFKADNEVQVGIPIDDYRGSKALIKIVKELWTIIDDIDTYSDMAKGDDKLFRGLVEKKQAERWEKTNITSDGYGLFIEESK